MDAKILQQVYSRYGWSFQLKEKQQAILDGLIQKKNVFGILPTGYGKSLPYMLHPLLMDEVNF